MSRSRMGCRKTDREVFISSLMDHLQFANAGHLHLQFNTSCLGQNIGGLLRFLERVEVGQKIEATQRGFIAGQFAVAPPPLVRPYLDSQMTMAESISHGHHQAQSFIRERLDLTFRVHSLTSASCAVC